MPRHLLKARDACRLRPTMGTLVGAVPCPPGIRSGGAAAQAAASVEESGPADVALEARRRPAAPEPRDVDALGGAAAAMIGRAGRARPVARGSGGASLAIGRWAVWVRAWGFAARRTVAAISAPRSPRPGGRWNIDRHRPHAPQTRPLQIDLLRHRQGLPRSTAWCRCCAATASPTRSRRWTAVRALMPEAARPGPWLEARRAAAPHRGARTGRHCRGTSGDHRHFIAAGAHRRFMDPLPQFRFARSAGSVTVLAPDARARRLGPAAGDSPEQGPGPGTGSGAGGQYCGVEMR